MADPTRTPTGLHRASAEARVPLGPEGAALVARSGAGDLAEVARTAGLLALKQVPGWLPHRHPLPAPDVSVTAALADDAVVVTARVRAVTVAPVGAEALAAAAAGALAVLDRLSGHVDGLQVDGVRLVEVGGPPAPGAIEATAAVIVLSDTVAAGRKPDTAGRSVADGLAAAGFSVAGYEVLPDDPEQLEARLRHWLAQRVELLVTVGGTGLGPRDRTVEVVRPLLTTEVPGLMEAARGFGQARTPYAALSRGVAGLAGGTVVATFPGSRGGAEETMAAIGDALIHLIEVQRVAAPHAGGYT